MSRYADLLKKRRSREAAHRIIGALASGKFCGASGQRCETMANLCCLAPVDLPPPMSRTEKDRAAWLVKFANKGMPRSGAWG